MSYSHEQLLKLAQTDTEKFLQILNSPKSDTYSLSIGAEILGEEIADETIALPIFKKLLKHINAVVREGAVIGITALFFDKPLPSDILERLKDIAIHDPSPALKKYAAEVVKDYD